MSTSRPTDADPAIAAARAAVLAEVERRTVRVIPILRPRTINSQSPLYLPPATVTAKVEARLQAGYDPESHAYPSSRTWARVVVPAIAIGTLDVPVVVVTAVLAALHVYLAWWLFIASTLMLLGASTTAIVASVRALRDPLRLSTAERRQLIRTRSWQSRQNWMGPRSSSAEYRLVGVAHETVQRVAASRAWTSSYLDEHRLRLNLAQELDGIDQQAWYLATIRAGQLTHADDPTLTQAWSALVDRVALLRHYADGITALDGHVAQLQLAANVARFDTHLGQLAAGSALDQFAAEHVRALSADLHRLTVTNSGPSRENAT